MTESRSSKNRDVCILCIEDNEANMKLVEMLFSRFFNGQLLTASTPKQGIEIAMKSQPELILLDINLPEMNGYDVLKVLRQSEIHKKTPIVALSANAMSADIESGLQAGFDDYITKPIDIHSFVSSLQKLL